MPLIKGRRDLTPKDGIFPSKDHMYSIRYAQFMCCIMSLFVLRYVYEQMEEMMKNAGSIKKGEFVFNWVRVKDGEVYGSLENKNKEVVESGFYRTDNEETAACIAHCNE